MHAGGDAPQTRVAETHISTLFFVGDRVYKLKKPLDLDFLDFTTREAREAACHREVELNRRLAPDVYLGVATVLGVDGEPCDSLVVMRRMPEDRRLSTLSTLSTLVTAGADVRDGLREVARRVATFHAAAETGPQVEAVAGADAVWEQWAENLDQMRRFSGPVLAEDEFERVGTDASAYVEGRRPLFAQRIARGFARDGHGDLLADDIFLLDDGPRILDCIEFNDRFRYGDVLSDAAFLAMDLERLGHPELGEDFLRWYGEFSAERHPATLAHHYVAYRAHVRAKVACLRHEQGDDAARDEARRLHAMCARHLEQGEVVLVVVGGLPGTGKSTLARSIASEREWLVLASDEVRKEHFGLAPAEPAPEDWKAGIYSEEATEATYTELLARARRLLELGEAVVVDATFHAERHRQTARRVAEATRSRLVELCCVVPADVAAERLERRARGAGDASDATPTVARAMAHEFDPWPHAAVIDGTAPPAAALDAALDAALGPLSRS